MDKNELEKIRQEKEQEAEELYRTMRIADNKDKVRVPCQAEPFWEISPFKVPQYVDPYRWVERMKRRRYTGGEKKPIKYGIAPYTTPYDESSGGENKKSIRVGTSYRTTPID